MPATSCYAVTVADVNGDQEARRRRRDRGRGRLVREPGAGQQHDIIRKATAKDNVCIQPQDIDGDGRVDFALGPAGVRRTRRTPSTLQWLGRDADGRWQIHPIRYEEPTLHRLRWGSVKGQGRGRARSK